MIAIWKSSRKVRRVCGSTLALGAVLVALPASSAAAATYTVNTTADNAPNGTECSGAAGDCSLRQALNKATSGDTVSVPADASDYQVTGTPISIPAGVSIVGGGQVRPPSPAAGPTRSSLRIPRVRSRFPRSP